MTPFCFDRLTRFIEIAAILEKRLSLQLSNVCGISFAEFRFLHLIAQSPEAQSPKNQSPEAQSGEKRPQTGLTRAQLAEQTGLSPSGVSRALKPLVKTGLLEDEKAARDARMTRSKLTAAGHTKLENATRLVEDSIRGFPQTDIEPGQLEALLGMLRVPVKPVFGNRPRLSPTT